MKKSLLFLMALLCMMMQTVSASAQEIASEQLPAAAKAFVQHNFPGQVIDYVVLDTDFDGSTYEICLNNGVEIEFDIEGNWEKVDCNFDAVPQRIIPSAVLNAVNTWHNGEGIVKIDKEDYGYEVELSNGLELKITTDGQLLFP